MFLHKSKLTLGHLLLVLAAAAMIAGCESSDDDGEGNGDVVQLGDQRQIEPGDTWTYSVSGTGVAPNGGVVSLTPGNGTWTYSTGTIDLPGHPGLHTLTLTWPVAFTGVQYTETLTFAFGQGEDGAFSLYGLSPGEGVEIGAVTSNGGVMPWPLFTNVPGLGSWQGSAEIDGCGTLGIDIEHDTVEDVTVGGRTYRCYRWDVVLDLGLEVPMTFWYNPQVGCVKLTESYPDQYGTTNVTLELQSTQFAD
jgi:hypothetical protein